MQRIAGPLQQAVCLRAVIVPKLISP